MPRVKLPYGGRRQDARQHCFGEVAERFKAAVLKTAVGASLPWVRIPPSPPDARTAPSGAVLASGGEGLWTNPLGFDGFAWSKSGQPQAGPRAARVRLRDEPDISHPLRQMQERPLPGPFLHLVERVGGRAHRVTRAFPALALRAIACGDVRSPHVARWQRSTCLRSRQICREQTWTAAGWPARSAGPAQGRTGHIQPSPPSLTQSRSANPHSSVAFPYLVHRCTKTHKSSRVNVSSIPDVQLLTQCARRPTGSADVRSQPASLAPPTNGQFARGA